MIQDPNVNRYLKEALQPIEKRVNELEAKCNELSKKLSAKKGKVNVYDLNSVSKQVNKNSKNQSQTKSK